MLSIGLMSGTSMDGIEAALLETNGTPQEIKDLGHLSFPYQPPFKILLKAAEYSIRQSGGDMPKAHAFFQQGLNQYLKNELKLSESDQEALSFYLYGNAHSCITLEDIIQHSTHLHAAAVKKLLQEKGYAPHQIDVVGYHGQAMYHQPSQKISIVVGDGQALAEQLGITVVNDFRGRDIAAGGEGAPLAPLYHQALAIGVNKKSLAVVNCGGIANITLITGATEQDLLGFDAGPGNSLIDRLVRARTHGKEHMDENGQYGKKGIVNEVVLKALYEKSIVKNGENYFKMRPPKSLDVGDLQLIPELDELTLEDACRTLAVFTAEALVNSVQRFGTDVPLCWILAGGGWNNPVIRQELELRIYRQWGAKVQVLTADEAGWNGQALEAQLFAYLAVRSLQNMPLSVPGTTRVPKPLSGGRTYIPAVGATKVVQTLIQNPAILG